MIEKMSEVFTKYHLPNGFVCHHFTGIEQNEEPHDHPWSFFSRVIFGSYLERVYQIDGSYKDVLRECNDYFFVDARTIHQIVCLPQNECITIVSPFPATRKSKFWSFREDGAHYRYWDNGEWIKV